MKIKPNCKIKMHNNWNNYKNYGNIKTFQIKLLLKNIMKQNK